MQRFKQELYVTSMGLPLFGPILVDPPIHGNQAAHMEMKGGVPLSPNKASGRARKGGSNRISFSEKTPKLVASK